MGFFTGGGKASRRAMGEAYAGARNEMQGGYKRAKANFSTGIYQNRQQVLQDRLGGRGGMSANTVNNMKGNTIESYGVGMREAMRGANDRFGDSTSRGMGAERFGRDAFKWGSARAAGIRDIDTMQAQMAHNDQSNAIGQVENDARFQAGFETDHANNLAQLVHGYHMGRANNYAQQGGFMGSLAALSPIGQDVWNATSYGTGQTGATANYLQQLLPLLMGGGGMG